MHTLPALATISLLGASQVSALTYVPSSQYCVAACAAAIDKVTFKYPSTDKTSKAVKACSGLYTESLFDCSAVYCSEEEIESGLKEENTTCIADADTAYPPLATIMAGMTTDSLANVTRSSQKALKKTNFTTAVIPDATYFAVALKTTQAKNYAGALNWYFAWTLCGFWGGVVCIGILIHVLNLARGPSSEHLKTLPEAESAPIRSQPSPLASVTTSVRRWIVLPLLYNSKSAESSTPTRMEGLGIALYLVLNFVFCFPGYHIFEGNLSWSTYKLQFCKYVANRTGFLALANIPVIWIFAARNNPLLWLTGWPYSTFSQFHRWSARVATVEAIVHAICYSVMYYAQDKYKTEWSEEYFWAGAIAVIAMSLLVFSSTNVFRHHRYEAFLIIHFVLGLAALVTLYYHLKHLDDSDFYAFIWACTAIWVLDRAARIVRVVYCSVWMKSRRTRAVATYDLGTDSIRLDVTSFFKGSSPAPGSFYYIYEPGRLFGYESHPFTICSWSKIMDDEDSEDPAGLSKEMGKETINISSKPSSNGKSERSTAHTFLIRPRGGFTRQLQRKICDQPQGKPLELMILLEGPYGQIFPLGQHSNVLMITGGSGVTAAVSRAYALLQTGGPRLRLHLVWAAQRRSFINDVSRNELKVLMEDPRVKCDIFLTRTFDTDKMSEKGDVEIHSGRPDLPQIISAARLDATNSLGVFCCGPVQMGADCRRFVTQLLAEKGKAIEFYEERFGW